ncbi:hypothetical protein Aperf_G00000081332 [Anoplocephala perfoliata]
MNENPVCQAPAPPLAFQPPFRPSAPPTQSRRRTPLSSTPFGACDTRAPDGVTATMTIRQDPTGGATTALDAHWLYLRPLISNKIPCGSGGTEIPTYIVKPSSGTQGKGIYLVKTPEDYCKEQMAINRNKLEIANEATLNSSIPLSTDSKGFLPAKEVVQRYEGSPVLIDGYKADLRIYVVLESIRPLRIHVYRDGLVRLASQRYQIPDQMNMRNSKMHLTNYSINKFPDKVDPRSEFNQLGSAWNMQQPTGMKADDLNERESLDSSSMKSKLNWQCKRRLQHLLQPGKLGLGINLDSTKFWERVDEIVRNTIFALVPYLRVAYWAECKTNGMLDPSFGKVGEQPQCFQIFGFDLLLVEPQCRPVLLEVNSSPSLRIDCMRPLVRFPSTATRQGLSPEVVVNSPKYSAFSRSRTDEVVKLGLLKATLLLMGSRIIHQRLLRYSPLKAPTFLEMCGYRTLSRLGTDNNDKQTDDHAIEKKSNCGNGYSQSSRCDGYPPSRALRISGNGWMSAQISQIYSSPPNNIEAVRRKATRPSLSAAALSMTSSALPVSTIPSLTAPIWPPSRCPSVRTHSGKQKYSEKLSEHFLAQPLSSSTRKARNKLHCIYAEDGAYPTPNGIFADVKKEVSLRTHSCEKEPKESSPSITGGKEKLNLNEEHLLEGDSQSEVTRIGSDQQASPLLSDSTKKLRIVEYLADIFIQILSLRYLTCGDQKFSGPLDDQNASRKSHTAHFADFRNLNNRAYLGSALEATADQKEIVETSVPRMDFTAFQIFFEQKLYWSHIYESDSPSSKNGLSFPAFVELCSTIADRCLSLPLVPNEVDNSSSQEIIPGESIKKQQSAFIAFVEYCVMTMKDNSMDPTPGPSTANSLSFQKLQEPRRTI